MILTMSLQKLRSIMEARPIRGYEKQYSIYPDGRIWGLKTKRWLGHHLTRKETSRDYYRVALSKNNIVKWKTLHRLLVETFISNPENKRQVNHIDGNRLNNNLNNLEWCSPLENSYHARKIGLDKRGRLTEDQVREVKIKYAKGNITQVALGKIYGVSNNLIYRVVRGYLWKHIKI